MSLPYLDFVGFRARTAMAAGEVDYVEGQEPGFITKRIAMRTSWMHARLRKRYGKSLPFGDPVPEILLVWLVALVTYDVMRKRGMNPQDPFGDMLVKEADKAEEEIKEAADSKDGLFDLPSPEDGDSNVSTGGPLGYSETSPYVGMQKQATQGRLEDFNGNGTGDD